MSCLPMNDGYSTSKHFHRFASIALLVCLVFQLGACPCGCLEHNAWIELLGLSTGDHGHDTAHSDDGSDRISIAGNHHDCTGEAQAQYVNTARDMSVPQVDNAIPHVGPTALSAGHLSLPCTSLGFHSTPFHGRVHALCRPVTQVFRL